MKVPAGDAFYAAADAMPSGITQGDIFLCPSAALVSLDGRELPPGLPPTPRPIEDIGQVFTVRAWEAAEDAEVPDVGHETRWGPVMVISHECDLQKDFSALARILMRERGISKAAAEELLRDRKDLDRRAVVSPLLSYDEVMAEWTGELRTESRLETARRGDRIDYFPLPPHPAGLLPEAAVSFTRMATVDRSLLTAERRLISLGGPARGVLRYKLGSVFAMRDASVVAELEAAIGQTITDIEVMPLPQQKGEKKSVSLVVYLGNGEVLHLQGRPVRPELPEGPSRAIAVIE